MQEQIIQLLRQLLSFQNINPPGNETAIQEFLSERLRKLGFTTILQEFEPGRSNLLAYDGDPTQPKLCLSGHVDVVPLGQKEWTRPAFIGEVEGDKIFGRGVSDMKGGIAALLVALERVRAEHPEPLNLAIAFTGAEEMGFEGAKAIARDMPLKVPVAALLIAEPTSNEPVVGHKGLIWASGVVQGRAAHGAMPELGINALDKAIDAIIRLRKIDFGVKPHPRFGSPTMNLGRMQGGINVNSVPDKAEVCLDVRLIPGQEPQQVLDLIRQTTGEEMDWTIVHQAISVDTDPNHPFVQWLVKQVQEEVHFPTVPSCGVYVTDASHLKPAFGHPPTVIIGPGEAAQAHKTDEFCHLSKLEEAVRIYCKIFQRWPLFQAASKP